jgi:hypothetical protein
MIKEITYSEQKSESTWYHLKAFRVSWVIDSEVPYVFSNEKMLDRIVGRQREFFRKPPRSPNGIFVSRNSPIFFWKLP